MRTIGLGHPFGLDYGAVIEVGKAQEVDLAMLTDMLPDAERAILGAHPAPDKSTEE